MTNLSTYLTDVSSPCVWGCRTIRDQRYQNP